MLKVLLVDDEIITIRMLQDLIDWKKYQLQLIGYAQDGLQAVDMFLKYEPDIVISDIKMPNMTGIELVRKTKALNKETAIILVSAYSDFAYISEAMKMGCSDYILKPIDENELDEALKKVVEKISGQNEQKEIIMKSKTLTRNNLLLSFMKTGAHLNSVMNNKTDYPVNFSSFFILKLQLNYHTINEYANMQHIEKVKTSYISHVIEEVIHQYEHILFDYEEDGWIILLSNVVHEDILTVSEHLKQQLHEYFGINIFACFSDEIQQFESLPLQYSKLKLLSRYHFYIGSEDIVGYGYNCNESEFNQIRGLNLVNEMEEALLKNNRTFAEKILNEVFYLSKNINPLDLNLVYEMCYQIIVAIKRMIVNKSEQTEEMAYILKVNFDDLLQYKSVISLKHFMLRTVSVIMGQENQVKYSDIVETGIDLLQENYNKNISLEEICKQISVSKNYFSFLFKQEVGISVWTYLTELRLNAAKKLLIETDMKNYEIAKQVGYDNPSYFSMLFKNHESMTPREYRKANQSVV